ncbi:NAD-dependent epimerase/dehydratase family protein [Streptomyces armeniacus]|uniref:NAD-dependent epimerase/dehydratase family protein n=1 Tax=Streptomyces armeniacus TaxID=83291 RepID=A0A345XMH1_9ACTN|nr:NAD-dependent epimerase/dehydratase family protein [Streptomyces armeniacus]AXK32837.1 NAD-dependent epimerase/dehydratase family protein [Streptomyces armeniacus]
MRLLVLGGTEFVGRAVVEEALARQWEVTVFNRGRHPVPEGATALYGDRTGGPEGLAALREGEGAGSGGWDAVVDTWSGAPTAVRDAAALLAGRAARYAYVSSCSVYAFPAPPGHDEHADVVDGSPDAGPTDYAADKRGGELAATGAFGADRSLLVRAGLILGPYENVGRLPWWLGRMARGGEVLAPGPYGHELQYVDVRDLAVWTLDALEAGRHGPYNLVSAPGHTTMGELLETCVSVTGSAARLRWTDPGTIEAAGIEPWTELPVWLPPGPVYDAMQRLDVSRALAAGLRCRPVAETVRDTWAWLCGIGGVAPQRPDRTSKGLDPEREAAVLAGG